MAQSPPSLIHCHTQEAHLKIHHDVLKLEFPVQVQLQKDGAHIWKDTKARNFRAETIYLPRLREIRNSLTYSPISLSKRPGTSNVSTHITYSRSHVFSATFPSHCHLMSLKPLDFQLLGPTHICSQSPMPSASPLRLSRME